MNKKGVVNNFLPLVTALVAIGITIGIGFLILAEVGGNGAVTASSNATASVQSVQGAMSDIPGWLPIIVVAVVGALLLGLVRFFRT